MSTDIYVTNTDWGKIKDKYDNIVDMNKELEKSYKKLVNELKRATIVDPQQIDGNIITMNTKVLLEIDEEDMEISLVYPEEADPNTQNISIFSPIGTAILGYREGSIIEWEVPSGISKIYIKKVLYQPEAEGNYNL